MQQLSSPKRIVSIDISVVYSSRILLVLSALVLVNNPSLRLREEQSHCPASLLYCVALWLPKSALISDVMCSTKETNKTTANLGLCS